VLKEISLKELRNEIEEQCHEDIPDRYVFLKSVGRAFTRVKDKQEIELKAKSFLPSQVRTC
jgi:hypothetical protein